MSDFRMRIGGFYGRNSDNSCLAPQPPETGDFEIVFDLSAKGKAGDYTLVINFRTALDRVFICTADPPGHPETSFFVHVPLALYRDYVDVLSRIGDNLIVTVGTHEHRFIEFFFRKP